MADRPTSAAKSVEEAEKPQDGSQKGETEKSGSQMVSSDLCGAAAPGPAGYSRVPRSPSVSPDRRPRSSCVFPPSADPAGGRSLSTVRLLKSACFPPLLRLRDGAFHASRTADLRTDATP